MRQEARKLQRVKRQQRLKITGLTWIVERSFAWLGRNCRLSKDYVYRVQISELMIDIAVTRLMLNLLCVPDLPATIELQPGKVAIQCRNMEHLLEQLVQLAKVLDNDYETLQHQIEQAIPGARLHVQKAALANQAVGSPGTQVR